MQLKGIRWLFYKNSRGKKILKMIRRRGEAFKQDVLQVTPRLLLFALMQENLAHIQLVFGVTTYNNIMVPVTFKGKVLGFVGGRTVDSSPEVILLSQPDNTLSQPDNTWKWKKCKVVFEKTDFVNHYSVQANRESLWILDASLSKEEK